MEQRPDPVLVSRDLIDERRALLAKARELIAQRRLTASIRVHYAAERWIALQDRSSIGGFAARDGEEDATSRERPG